MDNKKTYEVIGNELDNRIKKCDAVISGIKGELFDVLTLGNDEKSRKEIGGKIKDELDKKLAVAENKDPKDEKYIDNLKRIISDLVTRMDNNEKFKDYKNNNFIDLDKKNFNKEIIDQFAEEIIELSKTSNQVSGALWKRIYSTKALDKNFYQQLKVQVLSQFKTGKLNSKQRKNLTDIFGYLEEKKDTLTSLESKLHPDPNGIEKKELSSLQKKVMLHPNGGFELTNKDEIKERIGALKKGDEIVFKDGYKVKVTDIKLGTIKLKFLDTPSGSAEGYSGERERNKNDFLSYPDFQVGNIGRIIVPLHRKEKLKGGLEFKTEEEIKKRLESLQVGDRITFKDGYMIEILDKKIGQIKLHFHGTPSSRAAGYPPEGEAWWNLNDFLTYPKFKVKDIRQINAQKTLVEDKRSGIELIDRGEIKERLQTLEKGDRITFKDGYMVEVLDKRIGQIKLHFYGTPSSRAAGYPPEGEAWWNLNDFLTYPRFKEEDVRQIYIPAKRKTLKNPDSTKKPETETTPKATQEATQNTEPKTTQEATQNTEPKTTQEATQNTEPKATQEVTQNTEPKSTQEVTQNTTLNQTTVSPNSLKLKEQRERVATISNVTQINRAICQREADEELRQRYENVGWNIFDRANLFLRRKYIKDRIVNKKMGGSKDNFVMDWSESGQSAADRHQIEQQNALAERMNVVIQDIDADNYPETRRRLDELLGRLTGNNNTIPPRQREISDDQFKTEFKNILDMSGKNFDKTRPSSATSTNWRPISEIIKSNNMDQISTNILMQANKFREHQFLLRDITNYIRLDSLSDTDKTEIKKEYSDYNPDFNQWCRGRIKRYLTEFNDIPDFLNQMNLNLDSNEATKEIKRLQANTGALSMIAAQSLKLRIQMLDDGGEAYNVKKTGGALTKIGRILDDPTGGENTKFGRWMNKHQNLKEAFGRIWGTAKVGVMVTPALLLAPAGPLAVALGVGGTSFLTTLFKKKSHYEKEHRSYQRMQATNLEDYRARREELANEIAGMKWYEGRFWGKKARDRRQYRDYVKTTQDQMSLSPDLVSKITKRLNSANTLSGVERTNLAADVADGLARLDYHKKTGQNFLGSNNPSTAEKEYRELQNAVMGGARRLGLVDANGNPDMDQIRKNSPYDAYYNNTIDIIENGYGDDYNNQGYLKARKKFKKRSNTKAWAGAFKAGAISFGLSYLASSLASHNKTTTVDTYTSQHHGKVGGEYNPGDMQEHLFVSGDVNPTMNSVINSNTSEITGCQLYSSVDAIPCSAAKGAAELSAANADLAAALSNPVVSGNPNLVSAVHNYITDATTKIGMISGLDAGNHDLSLARAIEAVKEGILDPVISSGNSSVVVNPTGFTRLNGGVQSSAVGTVGQSFRNMGVTGIDYIQHGTEQVVEHVTRAIPIPVGLNTFGESKKGGKGNNKQRDNSKGGNQIINNSTNPNKDLSKVA